MLTFQSIWPAISLTLTLASITTAILLVVGTAIAWWLARSRAASRNWRQWQQSSRMPLVLPPTVLGFYLLIALGPNGPGGWLAGFWGAPHARLFSFWGLVIGSVIYSLPFMVQPVRNAFGAIGEDALEVARRSRLGAMELAVPPGVALPLARPGLMSGAVLAFAHTVGEFGVVLMIGGNIPGQTKVLAIAHLRLSSRRLQWGDAHVLAAGHGGVCVCGGDGDDDAGSGGGAVGWLGSARTPHPVLRTTFSP
jgi:molybdate transport system permease protein